MTTEVQRLWRKWLARRSQQRMTWDRFDELMERLELPRPIAVLSVLEPAHRGHGQAGRGEAHPVTLYALEPDLGPDQPSTIEPMEHGGSHLADAVALWRLVDDRRADALRDFLARAEDDDPEGHPCWPPEQVRQLVDLLDGLEDALREAGIMDATWLTSLDRVPDLARRVPGIDARPERTEPELRYALAEVVWRVRAVRLFLTRAAEARFLVELS